MVNNTNLRGIIPIVPTPFTDTGELALDDMRRLVDYYAECGVVALTILGRRGEAEKLSSVETDTTIATFLDAARGKMPVIVGTLGPISRLVEVGNFAMEHGAAGLMFRAQTGLKSDDAVVSFFERFVDVTNGAIPICVQDDPKDSKVDLSLAAWCRISQLQQVFMLKFEPTPSLQRLGRIIDAGRRGEAKVVSVMPSSNGQHLPQHLARGASGCMPGFSYTDLLVAVCDLYWSGDIEQAMDVHDALAPLMRYKAEFPMVARKELLRRRGVIGSSHVRYPGAQLDRADLAELDLIVTRTERRLAELGVEIRRALRLAT